MNKQITYPSETSQLPSITKEQHAYSCSDLHNEKCATHTTENLIFFCVEHTDTLCGRCVVSQHKSCNVVDLLEVNIDDEEVNVYRATLQGFEEQLKSTENKIHSHVENNRSCKEMVLQELKHLRTEVNTWFDRLQSRCKKQCCETFDTNDKCLTQVLTFCVGQRKDIEERKELIENLLTQNHIKRLYVALHRMRRDIEVIKRNVDWVDRESHFNGYVFKRSSGIQALLNDNSFDIGGLYESCTGSDEICEDLLSPDMDPIHDRHAELNVFPGSMNTVKEVQKNHFRASENESRPSTSPTDEGQESTSSISRRRSSALSLSTSKKDERNESTSSLFQRRSCSMSLSTSNLTKPNSASGVPKSEKLAAGFSQTFSPSSASTMSKALASTSGTRTAPKFKSQLFPETKLHQKDTKPKYSVHSAGTFDMNRIRPAISSPQPQGESDNDSDDRGYGLRSLPADLSGATNYRTKFLKGESKVHICAICLDDVRDPQVLKCKHEFCRSCIESYFKTKPSCPMCGSIYGKIVGNQPIGGTMTMYTDRDQCIPGNEKEDGMIVITYKFPDGMQDATHPHPGRNYKGIKRTCYLPNSAEGREVKRLLKKAFDARLLFTVGDSRTSGKTDVLTWNDVHHKTSIKGGPTKFGYPDPKYLKRVKEELAAKGITSA